MPDIEELDEIKEIEFTPIRSTNRRTRTINSEDKTPTSRKPSKKSIKETASALVGITNLGILALSKEDALDEREMDLLSEAVTAECMTSDRILSWMQKASGASAHFLLIKAIVQISVPRLQRHGLIPSINSNESGQLDNIFLDNEFPIGKIWNAQ